MLKWYELLPCNCTVCLLTVVLYFHNISSYYFYYFISHILDFSSEQLNVWIIARKDFSFSHNDFNNLQSHKRKVHSSTFLHFKISGLKYLNVSLWRSSVWLKLLLPWLGWRARDEFGDQPWRLFSAPVADKLKWLHGSGNVLYKADICSCQ